MKQKIFILFILLLLSAYSYSQVQVKITGMQYQSGQSIPYCGTIDFGTNSTVTVNFLVELEKPYSHSVGTSDLYIYTKKTNGSNPIQRGHQIVQPGMWSQNNSSTFQTTFSITLYANEFNTSGGFLYATFKSSSNVEYHSECNYLIIKTELPTFSISPTSVAIPCGSQTPVTFYYDRA